ncbi:MAG: TIGR01212 family radical SAM protein [Bdellovibrionales bacterium]|nr:TIGR01212 family radical SAM protein [Bdellovibrionales bacterium]
MTNLSQWQDLPYYAISQFYRCRFGGKVYKIPVSVAQTCPNREGLAGGKVCIFCDEWGSAAFPEYRHQTLAGQIEATRARLKRRFNSDNFLVYFQAYTTTFRRTMELRLQFAEALAFADVKGVVVGTRPDCLSDALFDLWNETEEKGKFVGVELGVQSFDDEHLMWMNRGHKQETSLRAIEKIRNKTKVDLGIHLIFGLPGETREKIVSTARKVNALPIDNVKLHNLHVLKNTPLEEMWRRGEFVPITREEYIKRVVLFLEYLCPRIAVHRLAAVASRHDELVAPHWARSKMETYQLILDEFKIQSTYQGRMVLDPIQASIQKKGDVEIST